MGRQIARSTDVVFCLTFAQLGSIGDERNVSKGQSLYDVHFPYLLTLSAYKIWTLFAHKFEVDLDPLSSFVCGRHIWMAPKAAKLGIFADCTAHEMF